MGGVHKYIVEWGKEASFKFQVYFATINKFTREKNYKINVARKPMRNHRAF